MLLKRMKGKNPFFWISKENGRHNSVLLHFWRRISIHDPLGTIDTIAFTFQKKNLYSSKQWELIPQIFSENR